MYEFPLAALMVQFDNALRCQVMLAAGSGELFGQHFIGSEVCVNETIGFGKFQIQLAVFLCFQDCENTSAKFRPALQAIAKLNILPGLLAFQKRLILL